MESTVSCNSLIGYSLQVAPLLICLIKISETKSGFDNPTIIESPPRLQAYAGENADKHILVKILTDENECFGLFLPLCWERKGNQVSHM
jgi:hypothetical protein